MKVALIQLNAAADKGSNIQKALQAAWEAAHRGAGFVLLPEVYNYRGPINRESLKQVKENIPGESVEPFRRLARESKVSVLIGSIYEAIKNSHKVFNTSIFINHQGRIAGKYRKIHLFDAVLGKVNIRESDSFSCGDKKVLISLEEFTLGLTVCYDVRFPQLYRDYARRGVNVFCIPSSFTQKTGAAHWEVLLRARAIENLCYVLAPNQIGKNGQGIECYGHSLIVSPWGEVVARASGDREEIIYGEIHFSTIREARERLPGICKNN